MILHDEIRRLPVGLLDAFVLHHLEGLSAEVAAQRLGCPAAAVEARARRGLETLRDRLARRGVDPATAQPRRVPAPGDGPGDDADDAWVVIPRDLLDST